jgi:hypothetical protein
VKFADDVPEIVRAVALYRRLSGGTLPKLYAPLERGMPCKDFSHRETLLWAGIGRMLGYKQREFSKGRGNKKGNKPKNRKNPLVDREKHRRNYRDRKRRRVVVRAPDLVREEGTIELEEGNSLDPPWKR